MSGRDSDLDEYLAVLTKLMGQHLTLGEPLADAAQADGLQVALSGADVLDLAVATSDMNNALRWLAEAVVTVAHSSPSIAFVLAGRYAADRALSTIDDAGTHSGATTGFVRDLAPDDRASVVRCRATVPLQFGPELTLLVDGASKTGVVVSREAIQEEPVRRTGLNDARLRTVRVLGPTSATLESSVAAAAARDLSLLTAAAALGAAEAALRVSEAYALERRQFGSNLLSFTAIRAMLVEMRLRVSAVRALLDSALEQDGAESACMEVSAAAGRAAVHVALDAIQVHGGYGYIEEYPVAGLLRDSMSLRARTLPRRTSLAALAHERFGPVA